MARANAIIGTEKYLTTIDAGGHRIIADEPRANGSAGAGPAPYDLLLASLCGCTAITLRMYADRKQWPMNKLSVELHYTRDETNNERIDRLLRPEGELGQEQLARLVDIAERTPVTLTLKRGFTILTTLG